MELYDIRHYRGYMPVRMEREDTLAWLGRLIGAGWLDGLWYDTRSGYHAVRYRFGDVQEAQLYLIDHSWLGMPIGLWLKFSALDRNALDDGCWEWIMGERIRCGLSGSRKSVASVGGFLDT